MKALVEQVLWYFTQLAVTDPQHPWTDASSPAAIPWLILSSFLLTWLAAMYSPDLGVGDVVDSVSGISRGEEGGRHRLGKVVVQSSRHHCHV